MQGHKQVFTKYSLGLLAVAFAAIAVAVKNHFYFDEDVFVTQLNSPFMQQAWQRAYLPKQILSIENFFFENNAMGYHLVSIVFHLLNTLIATRLLTLLISTYLLNYEISQSNNLHLVFVVFFLFTPVHSEPVNYILAQGILIFSVFALLSLFFLLLSLTGKRRNLIMSLLCFAASLLCYEISWVLPLCILVLIWFLPGKGSVNLKKHLIVMLSFFAMLLIWLLIKHWFISKSLVADYESLSLKSIDALKFFRNGLILFIRNFIPPFSNTIVFVAVSVCTGIVLLIILYKAFKLNKTVFKFLLFLLFLTSLSVVPACLFGIDSHDTESERYVYFSSVFAMMFLAVAVNTIIEKAAVRKIVTVIISMVFILQLFNSINDYRQAGNFSKNYLALLAAEVKGAQKVFVINQPSQYKGALMLRALTRLPHLNQQHHTVLNEYMQYLFGNAETEFITGSKNEVAQPFLLLKPSVKPFDSAGVYFNEAKPLMQSVVFEKEKTIIAALRNDTLFIFR